MGDNSFHFQKLTPVNNADISVYVDAINFVFDNADIKNVAISGAYSAGKSSILESYKAKHPDVRFVHLSLAHFQTPEQEGDDKKGTMQEAAKESVLEGKILNQLIHQIPADKIPQTNFRVKKGVNSKNLISSVVFACLFLGSIALLAFADKIAVFTRGLQESLIKSALLLFLNPYSSIVEVLICVGCSIVGIYSLIKAQKNKNVLRKISLQGNEIEIFSEQDDSYFDKYLNEVLYLFENVNAEVIVFEDMDRFDSSRIFERLREVNTLVNIQRKEKARKRPTLRFFYLLRDDIFISKDRTKFFDYIIPVVPVIDSSNSYEQFLKHMREGGLLHKFDLSFLQSLSLYVDDMRILKNIYNEFVIYFNRLNTTDLDCNKMLALITYKNLFPRDFSDLQLARGFVYELFTQKSQLIVDTLAALQAKHKELTGRIERAKAESLVSQEEVDWLYTNPHSPKFQRVYNTPDRNRIDQFQKELGARKRIIQENLDGMVPRMEAEIVSIERDIALTQTKSLKEMITRDNINSYFMVNHTNELGEENEFSEIKSSDYFPLLKFLIRNGFIDETYADYMTYFYDDQMSANDKAFLRRVTDKRGSEYSYTLREPKKVINSPIMSAKVFEQEETLNFDIFECILQNMAEPKYSGYLKVFIAQVKRVAKFDFISKFLETGKARRNFITVINKEWVDFFQTVLNEQLLPQSQIRQLSIDTLCYSDDTAIQAVNIDSCLSAYISGSSDYLSIPQPDTEKLISGFLLISVSFTDIECENADPMLFSRVYQSSLYELNYKNIVLMLHKWYAIENDYEISHRNYSLVMSQPDSPLSVYVSKNMALYTTLIIHNCDGAIMDDEHDAVSLLNNAGIEVKTKEQYIDVLTTEIDNLKKVADPTLWPALLNRRIIPFSIESFTEYAIEYGADITLAEYVNQEQKEVNFSSIGTIFGEKVVEELFDEILSCKDIANRHYRRILVDLDLYLDSLTIADIPDDKLGILINERIVRMTAENLEFLRQNYPRAISDFIRQNLNEYLDIQTPELFRLNEAMQIITWDIEDGRKTKLLTLTSEPISVVGTRYTDPVTEHIIAHNLKPEEKASLYMMYSQFGERTRSAISALAIADTNEIITGNLEVDDALLSVLLKTDTVSHDSKIMLFTMAIPNLHEEPCKIHFDELGLSELKGIFSQGGSHRKYEKNIDVTTVLDALKINGWIFDYRTDIQNSTKYRIVKNRPKKKENEFID